jgi:CRP-like cAMP-binding protein
LADLDEHDRARMARWVEELRAEPDEVLFEQGSMPYELFMIESGSVEVVRDGEPIATLGPGDIVGEIALLAQQRRMATVRAQTAVLALSLPAVAFQQVAAEMPEFADELRALMALRDPGGSSDA